MWLSSKNKQNMTFPLKKQQQPHALTGNLSKTITIQLEDHFQIKLWASSQMQAHRWACARWATEQGPPKAWAPTSHPSAQYTQRFRSQNIKPQPGGSTITHPLDSHPLSDFPCGGAATGKSQRWPIAAAIIP
jgi:hypothetical protein